VNLTFVVCEVEWLIFDVHGSFPDVIVVCGLQHDDRDEHPKYGYFTGIFFTVKRLPVWYQVPGTRYKYQVRVPVIGEVQTDFVFTVFYYDASTVTVLLPVPT
jgi:hypothetical protein